MRHREPKSLARMFDKRNRTPWRSRAQSRYDGSGKVSIGHAGWPALEKMAELVNARRYGGRVGNERGGRYSGRFWLPLQETEHVGGWLDLSGARPILELAEPLTPALREASRTASPDGSVSTQWQLADDDLQPAGLTVHGILRGAASRRVTLVGAITVGRQQAGGPVRDPGEQRLRAEYVLLGGHRTGADAVFTEARLRLRHLDAWAQLPGVEVQVVEDRFHVTILYEAPEAETAEVPGLAGRLVLDNTAEATMPTVQGASVAQTAELRLEVPAGMTLDVLWRRFVSPLAVLLTLAVGTYCPPVGVDVYSQEEGCWLEVRRPELKEPADNLLDVHEVLLTRFDLGVGHLAAWLDAAPALRPIPSLVAEVATAPARTLANQLLQMAIAAEGLHRRLRPNERVMSLGQADKARRLGRDAVPDEVRQRVNDALLHLEEPTYAERLRFLTGLVREAVPGATGDTEKWESRIKAVRNGFAHQVVPRADAASVADDSEWHEYFVLLRTLRWVLTGAVLLQTGLEPARLGGRVQQHEPYRFLLRQAQRWLPDLYTASRPPPADANGPSD